MYFPSPLFHRLMTSELDSYTGSGTIEPSYRYESNSKQAVLEVELPGVAKDDIAVDVNNHHLTVSAKRTKQSLLQSSEDKMNDDNGAAGGDKEEKEENVIRYTLNVRIGHDADVKNISCESYTDGVLRLKIPSMTKEQTRRIAIN